MSERKGPPNLTPVVVQGEQLPPESAPRSTDRSRGLPHCELPSAHRGCLAAGPALLTILVVLNAGGALAATLQKATAEAWDRYFHWVDDRVQRELSDPQKFLVEDSFPPGERARVKQQLQAGQVAVRRMPSPAPKDEHFEVPGGEIHHWWGAVLVPGAKLPELLHFLQDYDHHAGRFGDVERSRLLSKDGDTFRIYLRLKRSRAFVDAVYNTEQECIYSAHGPGRESSRSIASKIAEVENPGKPSERERPPGNDRGFLWRLASWWRFQQTSDGVLVELESASLSRDIPAVVKLIPGLAGYIRSTPRESLESVLGTIRDWAKSLQPIHAQS